MALVATPGAADANSYLTVTEADAYFLQRLNTDAWDNADPTTEKPAALIMATALLDAKVAWTGLATDDVQVLGWPRSGMFTRNVYAIDSAIIPAALKNATAELALWLLRKDRTNDAGLSGEQAIKRLKAGPMEIEYADAETTAAFSEVAIPSYILALLVPSWWIIINEDPIFEVL